MNQQAPQQTNTDDDSTVMQGVAICAVLLAIAAGVSYAEWSVMTSRFGYDVGQKSIVLGLSWACTAIIARGWWKKMTSVGVTSK